MGMWMANSIRHDEGPIRTKNQMSGSLERDDAPSHVNEMGTNPLTGDGALQDHCALTLKKALPRQRLVILVRIARKRELRKFIDQGGGNSIPERFQRFWRSSHQ